MATEQGENISRPRCRKNIPGGEVKGRKFVEPRLTLILSQEPEVR